MTCLAQPPNRDPGSVTNPRFVQMGIVADPNAKYSDDDSDESDEEDDLRSQPPKPVAPPRWLAVIAYTCASPVSRLNVSPLDLQQLIFCHPTTLPGTCLVVGLPCRGRGWVLIQLIILFLRLKKHGKRPVERSNLCCSDPQMVQFG